jgi:DNA-binding response OmpR family regulator
MSQYFERRPAAVVLDLGWHAEDAFEFCRQLRRLRGSEQLRIIGLLAEPLKDCRPLALEAGIDVCLDRSADPADLLRSLAQAGRGQHPL